MKNKFWTISNLISLSRMLLSVPFAIALWKNYVVWALVIMLIAHLSDLLDGYIARKRNEISEFGKIIDPLADKVFIAVAVFVLILMNQIPLWYAVAIIARDIIILGGGLYAKSRLNYVIPSNMVGKVAVIIIGISILAIILKIEILVDISMIAALLAMLVSLVSYFVTMRKALISAGSSNK